jgi:serine protease Do
MVKMDETEDLYVNDPEPASKSTEPETVYVPPGQPDQAKEVAKSQSPPKERHFSASTFVLSVVGAAFVSALIGGIVATAITSLLLGVSPLTLIRGGNGLATVERVVLRDSKSVASSGMPIVAVSKKVQPSVVNIRTQSSLMDRFHDNVQQGAEGSGVIFRKDGYIITNNHVVENADQIFVTIGADKNIKGTVVGTDPDTDLAVIKVNKTDLPAADLGSVKDVQVGEMAIAIGSPFGFEQTVTSGIVSALNRTVTVPSSSSQGATTYANLIQTDAAINPGNSGGALCDSDGRVIGINSLIFSQTGTNEGIGFAIPIDTARKIADQLIQTGKATHPYIGILGTTVDDAYVKAHKLKVDYGAVVAEVSSGSPADEAGLKQDDVIIKLDKTDIREMNDLIGAVRDHNVGEKVEITYIRDNNENQATLVLADKPANP